MADINFHRSDEHVKIHIRRDGEETYEFFTMISKETAEEMRDELDEVINSIRPPVTEEDWFEE